jgi:predicted unusual protein kinase regulating ubiquinone biosynthesis (AarF/ABC1/UbiB family)
MSRFNGISGISIAFRFYPRARYLRYYRKVMETTGKPPDREKSIKEAIKLKDSLIKSGPLFIKLGQLLSSRRDVVPEEYVEILTSLQDDVPMPEFAPVKKLIESEIGKIDEVFEEFDSSGISGASLGLVYRAKFKGHDVAVKVNRPNIREIIVKDKYKVRSFVKLLERYTGKSFSLSTFTEEFLASLELELDYKREAESIEIIRDKIEEMDLDMQISVPRVFKEVSTSKVLVMEYLEFIKITDINKLKDNKADLRKIARTIDKLFLRLALREGRFHADPHPGNLGWSTDNKIVLLDYGMTSELPEDTRDKLLMGYYYLASMDARNLLSVLVDMDIADPLADRTLMQQMLDMAFKDLQGKKINEMEYRELVHRANVILFRFPFRLPYNLSLFARMSVILEGVCKTLDSNFNFIDNVAEIMKEEKATYKILKSRLFSLPERISNSLQDFLSIPELLRNLNRPKKNENNHNYSSAIIASGLIVAGSVSLTKPVIAIVFFAVSVIFIFLSFRT